MKRAAQRLPTAAEFIRRIGLTVTELARALGRDPRTVQRMVRQGRLPPRLQIGPKRVGWRLHDLVSWLEIVRQAEWKERHKVMLALGRPTRADTPVNAARTTTR